jgi:hypothetical protein
MRRLILSLIILLGLSASASAQVNWQDTHGHDLPEYVSVNMPDEGAVSNKYWIDFTAGSGSTCSQGSPCDAVADLAGKAGISGGPAIVYIKGTASGTFEAFNDNIFGSGNADCRTASCDNWILFRTWPAGSPGCATECTATIQGNNSWKGGTKNHIIIDGGPDMKIRFRADTGGSFSYVWQVDGDYIVARRIWSFCAVTTSDARLWAWGTGAVSSNTWIINNEFSGCVNDTGSSTDAQISGVYVGASDGGGWQDFFFQNNIVRNMSGDGVEMNGRVSSTRATVEGNWFEFNGRGTCDDAGWNCRPHITVHSQYGEPITNTVIRNNFGYMAGSGCVYTRVSGIEIYNNTFFQYAQNDDTPGTIDNPTCLVDSPGSVTARNNVFVSTNGANPFDSGSYTASFNMCASGESCGTSSLVYNASTTFISTTHTHTDFLEINNTSNLYNAGTSVSSVTTDFFNVARPQFSLYDIGAMEVDDTEPPPDPPAGDAKKASMRIRRR